MPQNHPVVARFLARGQPSPDEVAYFLDAHQFPLTAPGVAVFAFKGDVQGVELVRWIHGGADHQAFSRIPGTDLWLLRLEVEDEGRFEYKLAIRDDGHEHLVTDPYNPLRAQDPFGENSECRTWGYERPDWSKPRGAPAGRIEEVVVESPTFGETRTERVYLPAGYDADRPYPLVVIHDGDDFVAYADLDVVLDNLIDQGDIRPLVAALVQTRDRIDEYARGRRHARYLVHELLPVLTARYALSPRAEDRVLLGASLGAVASLSTAWRFPGRFGGLLLKSGSFILDEKRLPGRHPVFHRIARLVAAFRRAPRRPVERAFVSSGALEGLDSENRALATLLEERGVAVRFNRAWDGHHWRNWRDQLRDGLRWVLNPGSARSEE
ncbi:MAG: alpha/beta hydrolase-fold protein [Woeseiaceae bacterium]